jgi:hypothetical protein
MPWEAARLPDKNSLTNIQSPAWPGFFHAGILFGATDFVPEDEEIGRLMRDKKAMNF